LVVSERSPVLKMGTTLASLSLSGKVEVEKDRLKICLRGLEIVRINFEIKFTERPLTSNVLFLFWRVLNISKISSYVTGVELRSKRVAFS